jgi:hypothetical protein
MAHQPPRRRVVRNVDQRAPELLLPDPIPTDDGVTSITVHYPEELYAPVQYHSFRVGGHSVTLVPRVGESVAEAFERGRKLLEDLTDKEFVHRLETFRQRVRESRGD